MGEREREMSQTGCLSISLLAQTTLPNSITQHTLARSLSLSTLFPVPSWGLGEDFYTPPDFFAAMHRSILMTAVANPSLRGAEGPWPPLGEQGYTHDACRSPAAVFTECAQFRARLSARPRKRVVGPPAPPPELKFAG